MLKKKNNNYDKFLFLWKPKKTIKGDLKFEEETKKKAPTVINFFTSYSQTATRFAVLKFPNAFFSFLDMLWYVVPISFFLCFNNSFGCLFWVFSKDCEIDIRLGVNCFSCCLLRISYVVLFNYLWRNLRCTANTILCKNLE